MDSRWIRVVRGAIAAAFATFVAALSHVVAGAPLPHVGAVALSLAFATVMCVALAGRTVSLWRTAASVTLSQVLFHTIFSGMTAQSIAAQAISTSGTDAVSGHQHLVAFTTTAITTSTHHSATMWIGHAIAALVTIAALRRGERAISGLRATASLVVAKAFAAAALVRVVPAVPAPRADWSRTTLPRDLSVSLSTMRHRGPPTFVVA